MKKTILVPWKIAVLKEYEEYCDNCGELNFYHSSCDLYGKPLKEQTKINGIYYYKRCRQCLNAKEVGK